MSDNPSAFPLAWPAGKPRTEAWRRQDGQFRANDRPITTAAAADRLEAEVGRLGGVYMLISSNVEVTLSGRPRSGAGTPADPGVCIYFQLKRQSYAMACDRYRTVAANLAAIAAHIEAVRKIERHGVASATETLQAFQALPSPKKPHEILGVRATACREEVQTAWRARIAANHPDQTGSHEAAAEINAARDAMLKALA